MINSIQKYQITFLIISFALFTGCQEYSESDYRSTIRICNSLNLEIYSVSGGVYASDTQGFVLNDSNGHKEELFINRSDEERYRSFCFDNKVVFILFNTFSNEISNSFLVNLDGSQFQINDLPLKYIKMKVVSLQGEESLLDSLKIKDLKKQNSKRVIQVIFKNNRYSFEIESYRELKVKRHSDNYFLFVFNEKKIESIVIL